MYKYLYAYFRSCLSHSGISTIALHAFLSLLCVLPTPPNVLIFFSDVFRSCINYIYVQSVLFHFSRWGRTDRKILHMFTSCSAENRSNSLYVSSYTYTKSRDSSVDIAMGYGVDCPGSFPGRSNNCFLLYSVHAVSEAHPTSYPMGTGV
jgi:hypothetical protein